MNAREDAQWVGDTIAQLQAENERLRAALKDAMALIERVERGEYIVGLEARLVGGRIQRALIDNEQTTTTNDPADGQITSRDD